MVDQGKTSQEPLVVCLGSMKEWRGVNQVNRYVLPRGQCALVKQFIQDKAQPSSDCTSTACSLARARTLQTPLKLACILPKYGKWKNPPHWIDWENNARL